MDLLKLFICFIYIYSIYKIQISLIDWLITRFQESPNESIWNLEDSSFLLDPKRPLRNGFDQLNRDRGADPLNAYFCKFS